MNTKKGMVMGYWRRVAMIAIYETRKNREQMPFPDSKFEFLSIYLGVEFEQFAAACDCNYWWVSGSPEDTTELMKRWVTVIGPMVLLGNSAFKSLPLVEAATSFCNEVWARLQSPIPSFAERLHCGWENNRPVRILGDPDQPIYVRDGLGTHWNDPENPIIFESVGNLINYRDDKKACMLALIIETFNLPAPNSAEAELAIRNLAENYHERIEQIEEIEEVKKYYAANRMPIVNVLLAWIESALAHRHVQEVHDFATQRGIGIQPTGAMQCARAMARVAMLIAKQCTWEVAQYPQYVINEADETLYEFEDDFIESILFRRDVTAGLLDHHAVGPEIIPDPDDFLNTLDDPIQWQPAVVST